MLSRVSRLFSVVKSSHQYLICGHFRNPVGKLQPTRSFDTKITAFDWSGKYKPTRKKFKNVEFEDKVVKQDFPVVVNFHADWCEPCHDTVDQLKAAVDSSEYVFSLTLVIEENPEIVHHLGIKAVPTLIAFHQGYQVKKFVGAVTDEEIINLVTRLDTAYRKRVLMFPDASRESLQPELAT